MAQNAISATLFPAVALYLLSLYFWFCGLKTPKHEFFPEKPLSPRLEGVLFGLILLAAIFLRVYKLGEIPSGVYLDASGPALYALKMLHEGFHPPFMLPAFAANPSYLAYLLAFWFRWFSPTQVHLFLFYVLFATAALPLIYWTLRQLAGPRTALLTLYFITIMRWHLVFSRIGFRGIQVPFYMFGTLAFFIHGLRAKKAWPFFVSALFLTGGLYTYQAFKAFPLLMLILLIYEWHRDPKSFKTLLKPILASAALCLVLAAPLLHYWAQQGSLGTRESELFIGRAVIEQKSLKPLVAKVLQTAFMFNRQGEEQPRHNLKNRRILDDVTGMFFVLGLALALWKWRQRPYFYALCGFGVMSLPGLLSSEATQSHRMLGALPFTAFFASTAVLLWQKGTEERFPSFRPWVKGLVLGLLLFAAVDNLKTYFVDQAGEYDCWRNFNIEASTVGKTIVDHPDTVYYLVPAFYQHFTVQYLDYFESNRIHPLDLGQMDAMPLDNHLSKVCFVLDEGKSPTLDFLKSLYPNGTEEPFKDRYGKILAFFYYVPGPVKPISYPRGLGEYLTVNKNELETMGPTPCPLINFTNIGDLTFAHPPVRVRWNGKILAKKAGSYQFLLLTQDKGELNLDGRKVVDTLQAKEGRALLTAGWHVLDLTCQRDSNPDVALDFHLLWEKPGDTQFTVVPNEAFGGIPKRGLLH